MSVLLDLFWSLVFIFVYNEPSYEMTVLFGNIYFFLIFGVREMKEGSYLTHVNDSFVVI